MGGGQGCPTIPLLISPSKSQSVCRLSPPYQSIHIIQQAEALCIALKVSAPPVSLFLWYSPSAERGREHHEDKPSVIPLHGPVMQTDLEWLLWDCGLEPNE